MRKSELRQTLAAALAERGFPLPNDFTSLTVKGLQERLGALPPVDVPSTSTSGKSRNATELFERAEPSFEAWLANPASPEGRAGYDAIQRLLTFVRLFTKRTVQLDRRNRDILVYAGPKKWVSFKNSGASW
jgi:hypothetical protein